MAIEITEDAVPCRGIRFSLQNAGSEIGHAYLYLPCNDLHEKPFGFMEDVWIDEVHRASGYGSSLLERLMGSARENAYKLVGCSRHERPKVHRLYERLGFHNHGVEFRIDF